MSIGITWLGTNSIRIETDGARLMFDPFAELRGGTNPNSVDDFYCEDDIFITHGHFDHLFFVPELMEAGDPTVYCSRTPARTLEKMTGTGDDIVEVAPGTELAVGDVSIRVWQGKHIRFDRKLVLRTLSPLNLLKRPGNLPFLFWAAPYFKENGETLCYELTAEGKHIFLMGSLGLEEAAEHPVGMDLLIMPYQGRSDLEREADRVIGALRPKRVMLSHYDNAYPPLSSDVDLRPLKRMLREKYPDLPVIRPTAGKKVLLP